MDQERVRELYDRLKQAGHQVWLDEENLLPGQIWEIEIKKAIQAARLVIILLSTQSVTRQGFAQKELRTALEFMDRIPEGRPYLVPLKLDDCPIPGQLEHIHAGTLYDERDFQKLLKTINQYVGPPEIAPQVPANYVRYASELAATPSLIIPGYGAASIKIGDSKAQVSDKLGNPTSTMIFDAGTYLSYAGLGIDVLCKEESVKTIFMYAEGKEAHRAYHGSTPEGVSVNSTRREIEDAYGRPNVTGGNGVINFWVGYEHLGLSVTYDTLDVSDLNARVRHLSVQAPN
jgi:hypothetical protein